MSVDASIDIQLARKDNKEILASDLIKTLIEGNWRVYNNRKIKYIPLGDREEFNWKQDELQLEEFIKIVQDKERENELISVIIYWKNTDISCTLMIFSELEIAFGITGNRKILKSIRSHRVTDVNWYLERTVGILEEGYTIENFKYSQY